MSVDPLVETEWLEMHLNHPELRVFDCTTRLHIQPVGPSRTESGRAHYETAHIPGAGFIDIVDDLSDRDHSLPFMAPPVAQFEAAMRRLGIGHDHHVILYGAGNVYMATRVWWLMRLMGIDQVSVLNGGLEKWVREGRPLDSRPASYPPSDFVARPRFDRLATRSDVEAAMADPARACVINALSRQQHAGTGGTHYGRPGRIPGSVNVPASELIDPDTNTFLDRDLIAERFTAVGVPGADRILTYCGGGIAASVAAFALALIGYQDVALYDASLNEWSNDPTLPMEQDLRQEQPL